MSWKTVELRRKKTETCSRLYEQFQTTFKVCTSDYDFAPNYDFLPNKDKDKKQGKITQKGVAEETVHVSIVLGLGFTMGTGVSISITILFSGLGRWSEKNSRLLWFRCYRGTNPVDCSQGCLPGSEGQIARDTWCSRSSSLSER